MKTALKFTELPPEYRTAYHGTNSLFLDHFRKNGLRHFKHPLLEEGKNIVKEILERPISAEKIFCGMGVGSKAWKAENKNWKARVFPTQEGFLLQNRNGGIYPTTSPRQAACYAKYAPELKYALFDESLYSMFAADVQKYHGSFFDKQLKQYAKLRAQVKAEFAISKPMVLTVVIPDISYAGLKEKGVVHEISGKREAWYARETMELAKYPNPYDPRSPLRGGDLGEIILIKPLE